MSPVEPGRNAERLGVLRGASRLLAQQEARLGKPMRSLHV